MKRALVLVLSSAACVAGAQDLPACGGSRATPPALESYDQLVPGARFIVTLRHDGRAWTPSPALRMPLHHASSIEHVGFRLPPASRASLELEVTAIERVLVRYDASHHVWFFTYRVRVESACTRTR